jgi:DNA-binding IclR family transcriptional regulator
VSGHGSAGRILAILDLFAENRLEWRPEEMMAALGYSRPTLYRYLRTLRDAGFLTALPSGPLTLGPRVTELDFLMRRADPLIRAGEPELRRLADRHPGSALLVRWYGMKLLCVASVVSASAPVSSYPRGRPMPLARGAISRAILAWLPRRTLEPLIAERLEEFAGHGAGATVSEVFATLRRVRRNGYAVARGEVTAGVVGIAAPIFAAGSAPIAALCLTSDETLMPPARTPCVGSDLRRRADAISASLSAAETQDLRHTA